MMQEIVNRFRGNGKDALKEKTLEGMIRSQTIISSKMVQAIKLWTDMYLDQPYWKGEKGLNTQTQNIPAAIAREFSRLITQESEITVSGSERGDYINEQLQRFLRYFPSKVEMYCAKGGMAIKPYISGDDVILSLYTADRFYPTAFDTNGDISGAVFVEQMRRGDYVYTRLEWHSMQYNVTIEPDAEKGTKQAGNESTKGNIYMVRNQAFRSEKLVSYTSDSEFDMMICKTPLQDEVPLETIPEWSDLEPEQRITGLDAPLFVYIKVPSANNIDTYCPLGVSVYSLAVEAIREADRQYTRCIDEFSMKETAIHASAELFKTDRQGNPILPEGKERVYRALDDDGGDGKPLLQDFSPAIRDASFFNGLEEKKRDIEYRVGLAYGTLSKNQDTAKTATEIKMSKQRSYSTVTAIQRELTDGLEKVRIVVDALASLYDLAPEGNSELSCSWGDNVLEDLDVEYQRRLQLVMAGMLKPENFVAWYFGCTEEDAVQNYMPQMTKLMQDEQEHGSDEDEDDPDGGGEGDA